MAFSKSGFFQPRLRPRRILGAGSLRSSDDFAGTQGYGSLDWHTWLLGMHYVNGSPYLYAIMQFMWEPHHELPQGRRGRDTAGFRICI